MKFGFRDKIYISVFSLLLIQGLAIFFWVGTAMKTAMLEEIKKRGVSIGMSLSARMIEPILAMDFLRMKVLVDETVQVDDDIFYTFILDKDGIPLVHTFKDGFPVALKTVNPVTDNSTGNLKLLDTGNQLIYDYAVPVMANSSRLGTLRLGLFQVRAQKVASQILISALVIIGLTVVIAAVAGAVLFNPVTKNIKKLHESSKQALRGNLDAMTLSLKGNLSDIENAGQILKEQKAILQTILDAVPDFISLQDITGKYLSVNKAFCDILGKGKEQIIGKSNIELFVPQEANIYTREDESIIESGLPLDKENKIVGPRGTRWIHVLKIPVLGAQNQVKGLVCSGRDITQIKVIQAQLTHAQKMESVGRLAAGVAHEINTPLGIILGYAQLLLEDVDQNSLMYKDIQTIVKQTKISSRIVADLLNFSRSTESTINRFDINEAITEIVEMVDHTFQLNHVRIHSRFETSPLMIQGDKEKIKQVFINLLNNAHDAIKENGDIFIITQPLEKARIKISVIDTGHGIAENALSKIFEPFYSTKGPDKGTGLGLSVTFGIIQEHHGEISVFSPPKEDLSIQRGAEFTVVLPTNLNKDKGDDNGNDHGTG